MSSFRSSRNRRQRARRAKIQRRQLVVEFLENRQLLAVDLEIPVVSGIFSSDLTLRAQGNQLQLVNTGTDTVVVQGNFSGQTDGVVNITRQGASGLPVDLFNDTIRIDLNSLQSLNSQAFVGSGLRINFDGGTPPPILPLSDEVILVGTNANLNYGFSVVASSVITTNPQGVVTATFTGPFSLRSQPSTTGSADTTNPLQVLAKPTAAINITGGSISAAGITLEAVAIVDVDIAATSLVDGQVSFATLIVNSDANVNISGNAILTTTGVTNLTILANSNVDGLVGRAPSDDGDTSDDDRQDDAAVANATVQSDVGINISGAIINVGGSANITSQNTVTSTTNADGRIGTSDAGGTVSINSILGNTTLLIDGNSSVTANGNLVLQSNSDRTLVANAFATPRGVTDDDDENTDTEGESALENNAETNDGDLKFAAAVAVSSLLGDTRATINNATVRSNTGNLSQFANSQYSVTTIADSSNATGTGGSNNNTSAGVGVSAAIQTIDTDTESLVSGTNTVLDGNNVNINASTLNSTTMLDSVSGPSNPDATSNGDLGVAGSLAIGTSIVNTRSMIQPSAVVDLSGANLNMTSTSVNTAAARALPKESISNESLGVGASFALNILDRTTLASVENNARINNAANVSLSATSNSTKTTEAQAGAKGGTAFAGALAMLIANEDTVARLESNANPTTAISGNLTLQANHTGSATTTANGDAEGGEDAGIGAAMAMAYLNEITATTTNRNLNVPGNMTFSSLSTSSSTANSLASATGAEKESNNDTTDAQANGNRQVGNNRASGAGARTSGNTDTPSAATSTGGSIAVAAALSLNIPKGVVQATIPNNRNITVGGVTSLTTQANHDATTTADASTTQSGDWGVGVGVAILAADLVNEATIGTGVTLSTDGLTLDAGMRDVASNMQHNFSTNATSGAGGGDNGIAGSVAIAVIDMDTRALVQSGTIPSTITNINGLSGSPITIRATNNTTSTTEARPNEDTIGASGKDFGLGGSFALARPELRTTAEIASGANLALLSNGVNPTNLTIEALADINTTVVAENGGANEETDDDPDSDSIGIGAGVALLLANNDTRANLGSGNSPNWSGNATLRARHEHTVRGTADGNANGGGNTGIGISFGLNLVEDDVSATIGRSLVVGGNFLLQSQLELDNEMSATASSSGTQSTSNTPDDEAAAQTGPARTNTGSTTTSTPGRNESEGQAQSLQAQGSAADESGNQSDGLGVSAAVALSIVPVSNRAEVLNGVTINATGTARVSARNHFDSETLALSDTVSLSLDEESESDRVAASAAFNFAKLTNEAIVRNATVRGTNVTVEAITADASGAVQVNEMIAMAAAAAGGQGELSVAGSVAINVVDIDVLASTAAGSTIVATGTNNTGNLTVNANNIMNPQTLAASAGFAAQQEGDDSKAIGGALAYANVDLDTTARIQGTANANRIMTVDAVTNVQPQSTVIPGLNVNVAFTGLAVAGAVSDGEADVAIGLALNDFNNNTHAYIGNEASINQAVVQNAAGVNPSIVVSATNTTNITSLSGTLGVALDGTGVGAGFEIGIIDNETWAYIGDEATVDAKSDISITATSMEDPTTATINAGVGDDAGVAGALIVYVITTDTLAWVGDQADVESSAGNVSVKADGTFQIVGFAGAVGVGINSVGFGASFLTIVHNDTVEAWIGDLATITTRGDAGLTVEAISQEDIIAISAAIGASSKNAVAGSATVNVLNETTVAKIGNNVTVIAENTANSNTPSIKVLATGTSNLVTVAGSIAASGNAAVGLGADVMTIDKRTEASIGTSVVTANPNDGPRIYAEGNIEVKAKSVEDVTSVSAGLAASGGVSVAVNAGVGVFDVTTRAFIGDDPDDFMFSLGGGNTRARGNIIIDAESDSEIDKWVGVVAIGSTAGIAAGVGVGVIDKNTHAFIGQGANVTAEGLGNASLVRTGQFAVSYPSWPTATNGVEAQGVGANPDMQGLQEQGEVGLPNVNSTRRADSNENMATDEGLTGQRTVLPAERNDFRGLSINATNRDDHGFYTLSGAGGTVGVAIAAGVGVFTTNTTATIGDNAKINRLSHNGSDSQSVNVTAANDYQQVMVDAAAAGGVVGVSPSVGVAVVEVNTEASIGSGALVNAKDDIIIEARSTDDLLMVGMGVAGGTVGIGGTVNVMDFESHVKARVESGADLFANGDVVIRANNHSDVDLISGAAGGGFVGAGVSVGVLLITKTTDASIADNAAVDALGKGTGVSNVLSGEVNSAGDAFSSEPEPVSGLIVEALSSEDFTHLAIAAGGGLVGVAGAIGISVVESSTNASIGSPFAPSGFGADINQTPSSTTIPSLNNQQIFALAPNGSADPQQSVYVNAANDVSTFSFAGGIAVGAVGAAGAVDFGKINNNTTATIGANAKVRAKNDVEVNALGLKDIDGYSMSAGGGLGTLAASVSVWSVGTTLTSDYSNDQGQSSDASKGSNQTADDDAAGAASNRTSQASGGLSNFQGAGSNSKRSENRVDSTTQNAATRLSAKSAEFDVLARLRGAVTEPGTTAKIFSDAEIITGYDITVQSNDKIQFDMRSGTWTF
ncbi:MAG: beta strand repeat-containing protein, partial [Pirellula sp.]